MPARRSSKSESRLLADELAQSRGRSTGAAIAPGSRAAAEPSARNALTSGGLRANPFDLLQLEADEDESAAVDDLEGCVEVETDAFDDLPPALRLHVPAPLTTLDWTTGSSPRSFSYRGTTKTLPRFASCAARAFPVYHMCAKRWLDPLTKQQLLQRGAKAIAKMLRPLSAACNAQIFGAYQHGLITREQACSKKPADIYFVMKVLGSRSFSRQHISDTEHAATAGGLSENTLGQHWCYSGTLCSLSDCATPFVAGAGACVPTEDGVRLLYRQRAARCKSAAAHAMRPTRPSFELCEEQCGAKLDDRAVTVLHHAAMEAAAALNPHNPRAGFPQLVAEMGAAALLCIHTADLESSQLGLLLAISLPAGIRQGTTLGLNAAAFIPPLTSCGAGSESVNLEKVHCKAECEPGARVSLGAGVHAAARTLYRCICPKAGAAERVAAAEARLAKGQLAIDVAASASALAAKLPQLQAQAPSAVVAALRSDDALREAANLAALALVEEGSWPVYATRVHLLAKLRQAVTSAYGTARWAHARQLKLTNLDFRWLRRGCVTGFLARWKAWAVEYLGQPLPPPLARAETLPEAYDATAQHCQTSSAMLKANYVLGGV
jgi:hypothetical protein